MLVISIFDIFLAINLHNCWYPSKDTYLAGWRFQTGKRGWVACLPSHTQPKGNFRGTSSCRENLNYEGRSHAAFTLPQGFNRCFWDIQK